MQDRNFKYFLKNVADLERTHKNKFVVVHHQKMEAFFDDFDAAYTYAEDNYEDGTYLVQQCSQKATFIKSRRFAG